MQPIDFIADEIERGPFHERQKAARATFYEDYGRLWTRSFGDPAQEYWAVRRDVGLWDVSALVKWRFTGPDALAALERLTSRRITDAEPGRIRYGAVLNERAIMLDEGTTLVVAPDDVYYFGNDEREPFADHVVRHTRDLDVRIENVTSRIPNLAVQGPRSFELLSGLTDARLDRLGYFRLVPEPIEVAGVRGLISRTGFTGELGYEFFLLDGDSGAERLWDAIVEAGARPIGLDAVEMLRIEVGLVIQEEDYWPGETDPYDLSLDRFIELDTHDFIGQAAAAERAVAPRRRFKTLEFRGEDPPAPGEPVTEDGVEVGVVTSAEVVPRFGALALAVLSTDVAHDGREVEVGGRGATVRPVPIDSQNRPRSDPRNPLAVRGR